MAKAIGVSASYVNMLENNQRSLSVQILMAIEEVYDVKWRNLVGSESAAMLAELRAIFQDPVLATKIPDIQELRALIDHAPLVAENLLQIYRNHRLTLDRLMRSEADQSTEDLLSLSPEAVIHDFFKSYKNYFPDLERAAECREPCGRLIEKPHSFLCPKLWITQTELFNWPICSACWSSTMCSMV